MEIRPILSAMWRNRTGSILIALQIALTLTIVVNSMFLAAERTKFHWSADRYGRREHHDCLEPGFR